MEPDVTLDVPMVIPDMDDASTIIEYDKCWAS